MRIAYVTSSFPHGGFGAFFEPEIRELLKRGHDVTVAPVWARGSRGPVLLPDVRDLTPWRRASLTATVSNLRLLRRAIGTASAPTGSRQRLRNVASVTASVALADLVVRNRIDHIHAAWATIPATVAMSASRLTGCPWSFTAHRWDIVEDNLLRRKLEKAHAVRFISADGMSDAERLSGLHELPHWFVGHLGVDVPDEPAPPSQGTSPTFACVGALVARKRHADLIRAFSGLGSCSLRLIGAGPEHFALEQLVNELGLAERVQICGYRTHAELLTLYRSGEIDGVVLVSESEGIPVSLMEAMAYGIPVVATRCGGIEELVDDEAGVLVDVGDVEGIRAALASLTDPARRLMLGAHARLVVQQRFDVRTAVDVLLSRLVRAPNN